jgi:predicted unusual protein kinase regulating ubiquinone biosynthesis (AarF/ABC1/UbiB family)
VHQAFLYDTVADRTRVTEGAPGPTRDATDNPYSRLAVEILGTIRVHELKLSSSIVAYLKMLVTLGALRHALATEYDLQSNVRQFVRRLARQQGMAWLDPRRTVDRLFAGAARIQRTLEFVEFLEGQEAFITEAQSSVFGFRRRIRSVRNRLVSLGVGVLLVGFALYLVLAYPSETRAAMPRDVPYPLLHYGLLALLVILIVNLIVNVRGMGGGE